MEFYINAEKRQADSGLTLAELLIAEGYAERQNTRQIRTGLAVAINQKVVVRSLWQACQIKAGDQIDVFQAIAGG